MINLFIIVFNSNFFILTVRVKKFAVLQSIKQLSYLFSFQRFTMPSNFSGTTLEILMLTPLKISALLSITIYQTTISNGRGIPTQAIAICLKAIPVDFS